MSNKRVVVVGEVFSANLGDYAIFDSLKKILISKDIDAIPLDLSFRKSFSNHNSLMDTSSKDKSSLKPTLVSRLKSSSFTQYLISRVIWYFSVKAKSDQYWDSLIKASDGVIIGGGQLITDSTSFFSPKLDQIVKIAQRNNKPFAIVGCGVGDNIGEKARSVYEKILKQATYVSFRDQGSINKVQSFIDNKTSLNVYPDLAFALDASINDLLNKKEMACGFNVMPLSVFKKYDAQLEDMDESDYLLFWKRVVKSAIDEKMRVVLMTNGNPHDYECAKTIHRALLDDCIDVTLFDRPKQPRELYEQIGQVDYLVAMRMHAGIIGQAFGKKVATIVWDTKIPDVWKVVGGESTVIDCKILKDENPWLILHTSLKNCLNIDYEINNRVERNIEECLRALNILN